MSIIGEAAGEEGGGRAGRPLIKAQSLGQPHPQLIPYNLVLLILEPRECVTNCPSCCSCITNYPQMQWLKAAIFFFPRLMRLWSGSAWLGISGLGSLMQLQSGVGWAAFI